MLSGNIDDLPLEPIPSNGAPLPSYWDRPGLYGVYNAGGELQYVAAVDSVALAVGSHLKQIADPGRVHSLRMIAGDNMDEETLGMMAENWVLSLVQAGHPMPPGNSDDEPEWRADVLLEDVSFSNTISAGSADARVREEIKEILREHRVVLFMKGRRSMPQCGFSRAVVGVLERQVGDDFVCVDCLDAAKNPGLREGIKQFTQWPTIPQLYVDGDFVGGADIVQEMDMNGELAAVLNS